MKIHRNLIWLKCDGELIGELMGNRKVSRLVLARPSDDCIAFSEKDYHKLVEILTKLGHAPSVEGKW